MFGRVFNRILILYHCSLGIEHVVRYLRNPQRRIVPSILRRYHATIGDRTTFKGRIDCDNVFGDVTSAGDFSKLTIGPNCYVGIGTYFDLAGSITLGANVLVSGRVAFVTHSDVNRSKLLESRYPRRTASIEVGDDCWLGTNCVLLPGVRIAPRTVIAAGAIVTRSTESSGLYAGVPARRMQDLSFEESNESSFDLIDGFRPSVSF